MAQSMRVKLSAIVISTIFTVLLLELVSFSVLAWQYKNFASPRERFRRDNSNTFLTWLDAPATCGYVDTLYPHPYLGFVHHANPPCGLQEVNNIGLFGPNYPSERSPGKFVILLTGGSVAGQFAAPHKSRPSYLEQVLNRDYVSPKGGDFQVLDGGDGAWKQPQQAILFLLYADAVDGLVTLDGFNEHYMIGAGSRFELPANNFLDVNPLATRDFGTVAVNWIWGNIHRYAAQNPILSRSNLVYLLLVKLGPDVRGEVAAVKNRRTTVQSMFALPQDWDAKKRLDWSLRQYQKYIMAMELLARDSGVLSAYFVQPVPAIDKPLTDEEKKVVGDLSYAETYRNMTDSLLDLRKRNVQILSLVDMFRNSHDSLYGDAIHMKTGVDSESEGYRLMAEKMATMLAETWHLKARHPR